MIVTAETVRAIKRAVTRECGSAVRPEDRFDLRQVVALSLAKRRVEPLNVVAWIRGAVANLVALHLRQERMQREVFDQLHMVGSRPHNGSLKRDPMVSYMAVKAALRGSGENEVEDALIACIDARARKRKGHAWEVDIKRRPTCDQDLLARCAMIAKRRSTVSHKSTGGRIKTAKPMAAKQH